MEPEEINIIVHSCKGLTVKKKGKSKFSVIFGIGSNKFRTGFVEDVLGSVIWNEDSQIVIEDNTHPLLFVVTDKDGALGQVSVPLETITLNRQRYEAPLRPHKKNNNPQGELSFSCWVSKYATLSPAITVKPEQKIQKGSSLSKLFTASPIFKRKEKQRHNNEMPPKRKNFSLSMLDVKYRGGDMNEGRSQSFDGNKRGHFYSQIDISASERMSPNVRPRHSPKLDGDFPSRVRSNSQESCNSSSSGFVSHVDPTESSERIAQTLEVNTKDASLCLTKVPEETGAPEVTGISPKEGTTEGQTRLTIRGTNLGVNLPDVVGLYVCGSNCLSTIEYISANKLHCTTKAWRPGSGDIIIVTQSGGRGKCSVQFTFVEPPQENQPEAPPVDNTETLIAPPSPLSQKNVDGTELEEPMGYTSKRKIHPTIQVTSEPSSGLLSRLSGNKQVEIKEDEDEATPPPFRKRGSIRDTSIRYSKETLMTEIKRLRDENKAIKNQNEAMTVYIDRLVSKVILHCPDLLNIDETI